MTKNQETLKPNFETINWHDIKKLQNQTLKPLIDIKSRNFKTKLWNH